MTEEISNIVNTLFFNNRERKNLKKFDIVIAVTNKNGIISSIFFKRESAKNLSSFWGSKYCNYNTKVKDRKIIDSLSSKEFETLFLDKYTIYIRKDILEKEFRLSMILYKYGIKSAVKKGELSLSLPGTNFEFLISEKDNAKEILSHFKKLRLNDDFFKEKTKEELRLLDRIKQVEEQIERAKNLLREEKQLYDDIFSYINKSRNVVKEVIGEDEWSSLAIVYEFTKGSFK